MTSGDTRLLTQWFRKVAGVDVVGALANLEPNAAVFAVDAERRIVLWSDGAERLLGFRAADVLGEHCLKANRCQACMVGCGIAECGEVKHVPLTLHRADGEAVEVSKSARAFFDDNGRFAGGVEMLTPRSMTHATKLPGRPHTAAAARFHGMVSRDPEMKKAFQIIRNVAETDATVLVRGESGSGKELVARAVHDESHRRAGPFLAVNCAALTQTLLESELFGHKRGAFTGAAADRKGLFEQADGGTLFLDEVAELSIDVQAKLLRVLEERELVPVGASKAVSVDVRVIAATHRALRKETKAGRFREDLMYRLRVVPIFLPPLRSRVGDVDVLLWHFIGVGNQRGPRRVRSVSPEAMRALLHHDWPGNARELRNVVEYAFAVGRGEVLVAEDLPPELRVEAQRRGNRDAARQGAEDERAAITDALQAHDGHLGHTAAALGISRPTLWRKRKKYGL